MKVLTANTLVSLDDLGIEYEYLSEAETSNVIRMINRDIVKAKPHPVQEQWNAAWNDVLENGEFEPRYLNSFKIQLADGEGVFRWKKKFIKTRDHLIEKKFHNAIVKAVAEKYFKRCSHVVEFGCGTGHNLKTIGKALDRNTKLYGADWAKSSQNILTRNGLNGFYFDMLYCNDPVPSELFQSSESLGVFTFGSMEQIGEAWNSFADFLKYLAPSVCIHIEPIYELYNASDTLDRLARVYHSQRGYLKGYYPYLEYNKMIKHKDRTTFGNVYNEGYTILEAGYSA